MANPNTPVKYKNIPALSRAIYNYIEGAEAFERVDGAYSNIGDYFKAHRDGRIFTVKVPLYEYTSGIDCIKDDANSSLVCEPSTNSYAGRDDYRTLIAFFSKDCNFTVNADGVITVTAIEGDAYFKRDGSNGDVGVLTPTLYWRITTTASHQIISISDVKHDGFLVQPGGKYTDGTTRPFIVYAKYAGVKYNDLYSSVSGLPLWNRNISQNTLIDRCAAKGAGYAGKTVADDWYVKVMFLMKYAKKSSQAVFVGCTSYDYQYNPAIAESGVKRVILTNSQANNLVVGSWMMLGTHTDTSKDRNMSYNYDVFDATKITRIDQYDTNNKAVYFDTSATFDTATTYLLSTTPWGSGGCNNVQGRDGSPTSCTSGKEPFIIQGIECSIGAYEILADVIMNARADDTGNLFEDIYICYDSANYSKSSYANYVNTGISLPTKEAAGWSYAKDFVNAGGLLVPQGTNATSTTGIGDGVYQNVSTSKGLREYLSVGYLYDGSYAGLWLVDGYSGLSDTYWLIASRLSALGRQG